MSSELKDALKKRLDENYAAFIKSLQGKTASELIAMAPEITAAQQLHEELPGACNDDDARFLLRFDDPLEIVRGCWESEITGYDHSEEIGHTLWWIQEEYQNEFDTKPISRNEVTIDPIMDFSGKEIVAHITIGFDVGKRFQVYPNADDTCALYAKYDPVFQTLWAELCIKNYDGETQWSDRWMSVGLLPSEQEMIVGLMEEICQKEMGKSLRDTWVEHHRAINKKNSQEKKNGRHKHER